MHGGREFKTTEARLLVFFLAALLLVLGTVTAACGGDLTLAGYSRRVETILNDMDERSAALTVEYRQDLASADTEEERLAATRDFYQGGLSLLRGLEEDLDAIDPPTEVEDIHRELEDAVAGFIGASEEFYYEFGEEGPSEIQWREVSTDRKVLAAGGRVEEACLKLQRVADENSIDVDLGCAD